MTKCKPDESRSFKENEEFYQLLPQNVISHKNEDLGKIAKKLIFLAQNSNTQSLEAKNKNPFLSGEKSAILRNMWLRGSRKRLFT